MTEIVIEPATGDRFRDVERALTGGGDGASCQCQWWTLTNAEWNATSTDDKRGLLEREVAEPVAPGLLAYVDGEPAAWVRIGPRPLLRRLPRTRAAAPHLEDLEDGDVWSISCFSVRREHRRLGLTKALLEQALHFAADHGAHTVEGYPVDQNTGKRIPTNDLYQGTLTIFLDAGFVERARLKPHWVLVSRSVTPGAST